VKECPQSGTVGVVETRLGTDVDRSKIIAAAFREIRDQIGELLKRHPDCGGPAGEILRALGRIEDAGFDNNSASPPTNRSREILGIYRRNKAKRYLRELVGGSEVLAEYRHDSPIPLRAPKEIVEAVAEILSKAKKSLSFGALHAELGRRFGGRPAEYQARIALRFLASQEVRLVTRRNAKYQAVDAQRTTGAAKSAWKALPKRQGEP
jgi:hypothetical protein